MVMLGRAIGARAYLMTMPYDETRRDYGGFVQVILDHNRIIRELGAELGVEVIDLHRAIQGRTDIWVDLVHFKSEFLGLKAECIATALGRTGALRMVQSGRMPSRTRSKSGSERNPSNSGSTRR